MAKRVIAAVLVASLLSGCASVHRVVVTPSGSELDDLNRVLQDRRVSVQLRVTQRHPYGLKLHAENVRVGADSTSLTVLRRAKRDTTLSTSAISSITITKRVRATLQGTLLGLSVGAVVGFIIGAASYEPGDYGFPFYIASPGEAGALAGIYLGVLGSGVGFVCGALAGSEDIYDLTRTPTEVSAAPRR